MNGKEKPALSGFCYLCDINHFTSGRYSPIMYSYQRDTGIKTMTKQEALKQMNEATNEMARMTEGSEIYKAAKAKHIEAKRALIAIMSKQEEQEVIEEVESAEQELTVIVEKIEERKSALIKEAGVNVNSTIAAIASGAITAQTEWETTRIYELKQIIMAGGEVMARQARQRNLARVNARKLRKMEAIA